MLPLLLAALAIVLAASPGEVRAEAASGADKAGIAYTVRFRGTANDELEELLKSISRLKTLESRPPSSLGGLERRAAADMKRLGEALRSEGYYGGVVSYRILRERKPVRVRVTVDPGEPYLLAAYDISYDEAEETDLPRNASSLGLSTGQRARAPLIVDAEAELLARLAELGRPFARISKREVVVDHRDLSVRVDLRIAAGPPSRFGALAVEGLEDVRESYIRRRIPWREGDRFDSRQIELFRARLAKGNLFRAIEIEAAQDPLPDGATPLAVTVSENKHRSIGASVGYSTTEYLGGEVFWEHRNMFGRGEIFRASAQAAALRQGFSGDLLIPDFRRLDQNLNLNVQALHEDTDAYESWTLSSLASVDRKIAANLRANAGLAVELSDLRDDAGRRTFGIAGLPLALRWDRRDDPIDTTRGFRVRLGLTPSASLHSTLDFFVVGEIEGAAYIPLAAERLVLALRAKLGAIAGTATADIPARKRFYSGGGGSVRGYDYQLVGPLDAEGAPLGGRSVAEAGAEVRVRLSERIGLAPFVEGGAVYDTVRPRIGRDIRWAAGLGGRYYTAIGPVRLDVAFPLNRRAGIDDTFEFYISIGQAF